MAVHELNWDCAEHAAEFRAPPPQLVARPAAPLRSASLPALWWSDHNRAADAVMCCLIISFLCRDNNVGACTQMAADCVYNEEIVPALLRTMGALSGPETVVLISLELRSGAHWPLPRARDALDRCAFLFPCNSSSCICCCPCCLHTRQFLSVTRAVALHVGS